MFNFTNAAGFVVLLSIAVFFAVNMPVVSAKDNNPGSVVEEFYDWYLKTPRHREYLSEQEDNFSKELYDHLVNAFKKQPGDGAWVDFDPFINAQMDAKGYKIADEKIDGVNASVKVKITMSRGGENALKVFLKKIDGQWKIANFIYDKDFDLLSFLKEVNKEN